MNAFRYGRLNQVSLILIVGGTLTSLISVGLLINYFGRDRWEQTEGYKLPSRVDEADKLKGVDDLRAYELYCTIVKDAEAHPVGARNILDAAERAAKSRDDLFPIIQDSLRRKQAQEEAAAEVARRAKDAERTREEAAAALRQSKEALQQQEIAAAKRRKDLVKIRVAAYKNAPMSAKKSLAALKRLQARIEIGINYSSYSDVLGETWADVKPFVESPEGEEFAEFSDSSRKAIDFYKAALENWKKKLELVTKERSAARISEEFTLDLELQSNWNSATSETEKAARFLDQTTCESALEHFYKKEQIK